MQKIKDLEYIDLKVALGSAKDEIERCLKVIGITRIVQDALETEIKKYPPPKKPINTTIG